MKKLKLAVLTIALSLLLCACSGGGRQSLSNASPSSPESTSSGLFECVYTNEGNFPTVDHIFYIYRYIPDDTLFLVRSNYGGVTQMFNGHKGTYPAHYADDLELYLNP